MENYWYVASAQQRARCWGAHRREGGGISWHHAPSLLQEKMGRLEFFLVRESWRETKKLTESYVENDNSR